MDCKKLHHRLRIVFIKQACGDVTKLTYLGDGESRTRVKKGEVGVGVGGGCFIIFTISHKSEILDNIIIFNNTGHPQSKRVAARSSPSPPSKDLAKCICI